MAPKPRFDPERREITLPTASREIEAELDGAFERVSPYERRWKTPEGYTPRAPHFEEALPPDGAAAEQADDAAAARAAKPRVPKGP